MLRRELPCSQPVRGGEGTSPNRCWVTVPMPDASGRSRTGTVQICTAPAACNCQHQLYRLYNKLAGLLNYIYRIAQTQKIKKYLRDGGMLTAGGLPGKERELPNGKHEYEHREGLRKHKCCLYHEKAHLQHSKASSGFPRNMQSALHCMCLLLLHAWATPLQCPI